MDCQKSDPGKLTKVSCREEVHRTGNSKLRPEVSLASNNVWDSDVISLTSHEVSLSSVNSSIMFTVPHVDRQEHYEWSEEKNKHAWQM